ncbi:hypothetical protein [Crocosphaera sp. XPORK-15E]|uniref:hypothetical protein n=1 Tax=Crocosphaera sp. XPORK-15E TaxID=3110247 RepID=UPI002B1EA955|nr:hypothetical protein [Crocosphaera sp. XPORK-15E]MEA5534857.1 hypothetical protein [Crocosphaera sp. XPORK-15E]
MSVVVYEEFYKKICKDLKIPRNHPVESQIKQFLSYCHYERLKDSYGQLSSDRKELLKELYPKRRNWKKSGTLEISIPAKKESSLSDREQALVDPNRFWGMVKGEYNRSLREYAFLYLAFNVLEDSLRCAVDLHYTKHLNNSHWYKDRNCYPKWIEDKRYTQWFPTELSFAETIAFISDSSAWDSYQTKTLFDNKKNPENTNETLSKLSRSEVDEKLTILRHRRNKVYHHNLISDGTVSNTRDRIYEILRYLGLKPKLVMERIIGNSETLPLYRGN